MLSVKLRIQFCFLKVLITRVTPPAPTITEQLQRSIALPSREQKGGIHTSGNGGKLLYRKRILCTSGNEGIERFDVFVGA